MQMCWHLHPHALVHQANTSGFVGGALAVYLEILEAESITARGIGYVVMYPRGISVDWAEIRCGARFHIDFWFANVESYRGNKAGLSIVEAKSTVMVQIPVRTKRPPIKVPHELVQFDQFRTWAFVLVLHRVEHKELAVPVGPEEVGEDAAAVDIASDGWRGSAESRS